MFGTLAMMSSSMVTKSFVKRLGVLLPLFFIRYYSTMNQSLCILMIFVAFIMPVSAHENPYKPAGAISGSGTKEDPWITPIDQYERPSIVKSNELKRPGTPTTP